MFVLFVCFVLFGAVGHIAIHDWPELDSFNIAVLGNGRTSWETAEEHGRGESGWCLAGRAVKLLGNCQECVGDLLETF